MKRFVPIAATLVMLFAYSAANAEGYAGFRLGANLASFTGDDADQVPDTRMGFTGGGFIGFDSGKHLGFRTDLLYTMKGGVEDEYSEIKLDYFELAPLLVVRFPLTGRFTMRGFIGPMVGLWVNAEATFLYDDGIQEGEADIDLGEIVEHWEFSGVIGAELDMAAGPYVVLFEARYTQGSRVFEDRGLDLQPLDFKVSNSGIGIMAGLMVPF